MQLILPISGPLHKILVHVYSIRTHKHVIYLLFVLKSTISSIESKSMGMGVGVGWK